MGNIFLNSEILPHLMDTNQVGKKLPQRHGDTEFIAPCLCVSLVKKSCIIPIATHYFDLFGCVGVMQPGCLT